MESIVFSLSMVLPIILLFVLGYSLNLFKIISKDFEVTANKLCYNIFIPCLVFYSIYTVEVDTTNIKRLVAFLFISNVIWIALLLIFTPMVVKDNQRRGPIIQALYRGNVVIFGFPIIKNMYGAEGAASVAIAAMVTIPLYNMVTIPLLAHYSHDKAPLSKELQTVTKDILKNPMIISALGGILCKWLDIKIYYPVLGFVEDLSQVAIPLALIVMGKSLNFKGMRKNIKSLISVNIIKLLILPCAMILIALKTGFSGVDLGTIMCLYTTPVAVVSYAMVYEVKADYELANQIVISTTCISCCTVLIFIYVFKINGFI